MRRTVIATSRQLGSIPTLLLACVCLMLPVPLSLAQSPTDQGVWRTAAPAPTKRTEVGTAAVRDKIYMVGGFERPSFSNVMNLAVTPSLEEYDLMRD